MASSVTGVPDKLLVKRADRISKGQVLATLESRAELAHFKSVQVGPSLMAESKIEFAKRKFTRRQAMSNEKLMAAQDRDDAEAELRLAESELKVASKNRHAVKFGHQRQNSPTNPRAIRRPFDDVVVEPGSNKKSVAKTAQFDPLKIQVVLPNDAFGKVSAGMSVEVWPEIPAKGRYTTKVKSVVRLIDAASSSFGKVAVISNEGYEQITSNRGRYRATVLPRILIQVSGRKAMPSIIIKGKCNA